MIDIQVDEMVSQQKRFLKRGRPTPDTPFALKPANYNLILPSIRNESKKKNYWQDGYVTNTPSDRMTLEQSVKYYRDEWLVERSFHRFKGGKLPILPLFLRLDERIKGLMMLLTIALQVLTLTEFVSAN